MREGGRQGWLREDGKSESSCGKKAHGAAQRGVRRDKAAVNAGCLGERLRRYRRGDVEGSGRGRRRGGGRSDSRGTPLVLRAGGVRPTGLWRRRWWCWMPAYIRGPRP